MRNCWLIVLLSVTIWSCKDEVPEKPTNDWQFMRADSLKKVVENANRDFAKIEELEIMAYLNSRGLDSMTRTGTGLRYQITSKGKGDSAACNMVANVRYAVGLLNDTICYSSLKTGDVETFMICLDYVETGLHEGVTYMREGDKATLIMPSILAHGFLGDRACIPPRSPIRIDLELVKLTQ